MKYAFFVISSLVILSLSACKQDAGSSNKAEAKADEPQALTMFDSVAHAKQMEENRKRAEANLITEENFEKKAPAGAIAVGKMENTSYEKKDAIVNAAKSFLAAKSIGITQDNGYYGYNLTDLNGDGTEDVLIYLTGANFCDGGNCTLLIGKGEAGGSFKIHSMIQFLSLPVLVSESTTSKGWKDIITQIFDEEGVATSVKLGFNGSKYPDNPRLPNSKVLNKPVKASGFLMSAGQSGLNLTY